MADRALQLLAVLGGCALVLALSVFPSQSDDLLIYVTMGRTLVHERSLAAVDPFVYPQLRAPIDFVHEWGTLAVAYLAHALGGWPALILGKAALILFAFLLPVAVARAAGLRSFLVPLYGAFAFRAASLRFIERGSLASDVLTALVTALVLLARRGPSGRRLLPVIPVLFAAWVNLHGGFFIGLAVLFLWFLAEAAARFLPGGAAPGYPRAVRDSLATFLASALACLLNPRGVSGLLFPLAGAVFNPAFEIVRRNYNEFKPPFDPLYAAVAKPYLASLLLCVLLAAAVCVLCLRARRPLPLFELLVLGLVAALALNAVRFMLTVAFTSSVLFAALLARSGLAPTPAAAGARRGALRAATALTAAGCLLLAGRTAYAGYPSPFGARRIGFGLDEAWFPVRATAFIDEVGLRGNVFNEHRFGAYLIWKWRGARPIYYHGFVGNPEHYREYFSVNRSPEQFDAVVRAYDIKVFLLATHLPTTPNLPYLFRRLYTDPAWHPVYVDGRAEVFVREAPETREVIRRYSLRGRLPGAGGAGWPR